MSKNKIEVNKDSMFDKSKENEIIEDISKEQFFDWVHMAGLDEKSLSLALEDKIIEAEKQCKFNIIIRKAKEEMDIPIIDCILYLDGYLNKTKKLLAYLDGDTMNMLKEELAEKHHIKIDRNELYKLLQ